MLLNYEYELTTTSSLPHGRQADGISCGVCVADVVAHAVLGEEAWTQETAAYRRLRWADRLAAREHQVSSDADQ